MSPRFSPLEPIDLSGAALLAGTSAHGEALVLASTRALASGRPRDAFALADRRCRLSAPPPASALALRALSLWFLDARSEAAADLARAFAADPADPLVALVALQLSKAGADLPDPALLVAETATAHELLRLALARLFAGGRSAFARLDLLDGRLLGWVAWTGEADTLTLSLTGDGDEERRSLAAEPGFAPAPAGAKGAFVDWPASMDRRGFALHRPGDAVPLCEGRLWPRSGAAISQAAQEPPRAAPEPGPIVVLIPVYEDFEATQDCLRAAVAAKGPAVRVLVVDDASPNRRLRLLLDALAGRGLVDLLRNESNLGFAGAVNRGLASLQPDEDVLILNSDAVLPSGAVARLGAVAYGEASIGTVTPLSNAGELTSFPVRSDRAPLPTPEAARDLDALAARLHGASAIDLPTGTGFCLFLRHDARAAVRQVSSLFGRGYFEDLDLCLRVRAAGFRNVAAPGIFVAHGGGRSFSAERGALLACNRRVADRRFPEHRPEATAFAVADPLRAARGRIEAACKPGAPARLVVFARGDVAAGEHLFRLAQAGTPHLALEWRQVAGQTHLRLRAGDPAAAPRSLEVPADDPDGWPPCLADLGAGAIDLVGPPPPDPLCTHLRGLDAPVDWLLEGPEAAELLSDESTTSRLPLRRILVADEGTQALLAPDAPHPLERLRVEDTTSPRAAPAPALGILMPAPSLRANAFLRSLSALLRQRAPEQRIMVLGRPADEAALFGLGNVFATGTAAPAELAPLARHLALGALCLPPGLGGWAQLERLVAETGLPAAAIDPAARPGTPLPHLYLDPAARDRDNALALVDWLLGGVPPPPS